MFTPSTHEFVGTDRVFMPQGYSPYAPVPNDGNGRVILNTGDRVTVLSAWTRGYLPANAPILLYVHSHNTGERTHVTASDLKLRAN